MSSVANTFLRLNSTSSQPGSPTSLKGSQRLSMAGSTGGGAPATVIGIDPSHHSIAGTANNTNTRCGGACWRYLSSNPKLKKGLAHAGLVLLLCFYTAAGASVTLPFSHFIETKRCPVIMIEELISFLENSTGDDIRYFIRILGPGRFGWCCACERYRRS